MIYWFGFHLLIITLLAIYSNCKNVIIKKRIVYLIIFFLIYFSGFRDGLGSDYDRYIVGIAARANISNLVFGFSEPLFNFICIFIDVSIFSPILFFLLAAYVTNAGICGFLFKDNLYAAWSILFYLLIPTLYPMSFNIVRQFFSVGIFFYSLRFLGVSFKKYFFLCLLAALMHMSAIILIPFYWILNKNIKRNYLVIGAVALSVLLFIGISIIGSADYKYSETAYSEDSIGASGLIFFYNLLFLLFIINKKVFSGIKPLHRNLFVLYIIIVDMSFSNYNFYRLSYYFYPIVTVMIPYVFCKYFKNNILNVAFVSILLLSQYVSIVSNIDDKTVVPQKILPVLSVFDKYYIDNAK